jgi:hypothetical protein
VDLLRHLVVPALVIAGIVLIDVVRRWWVRRAVEASPDGRGHGVSVRLRGSVPPWPTRERWGRVSRLDDGRVVFVPTFRGEPMALGGLTLRTQKLVESRRLEMLLRFTDDVGADVEITVDEEALPLLEALLAGGDPTGDADSGTTATSAGLRVWTVGIVIGTMLSVLSLVIAWWAIVASVPVSATVVGRTTSACVVEWLDPGTGRTEQDTADCDSDARNGDVLDLHATAWPIRGYTMADSFRYGAFGGLALIVCGCTAFALVRRRRAAARVARLAPASHHAPRGPVVVETPDIRPLEASELSWDAMTEMVRTRADAERWSTLGDPRDAPPIPQFTGRFPWWTVRPVRRSLLVPFAGMLTAALALVATVLYAAPWAARSAALRGDTVVRSATVSDVPADQLLPFLPSEITVEVDTGSGTREASVTWSGPPPAAGTTISVETAVDDASQARSVDHDGLALMTVLGAVATLALSAMLGVGVLRRRRQVLTTASALRAGTTPVRYVLLIDPAEVVFVLLSPGDGPPQVVPSLAMVAIGAPIGVVPAAGTAIAHGELRAGERVVSETPQGAVWPFSALMDVDDEVDVLAMVNAWHGVDDDERDEG